MTYMQTYVEIEETDVSNLVIAWKDESDLGEEIQDIEIYFAPDIYTDIPGLKNGTNIIVKRGFDDGSPTDQNIFDGYVDTVQNMGSMVRVQCRNQLIKLVWASVTYSYNGVAFPLTEAKGSDIMTDLIETWGGMTADVVDTGDVLTLKKFICRGTDVWSRLKVLLDIFDYQAYYDSTTGKVKCEPKGYTTSSTALEVGNNVANIPKWEFDNTQCVNRLIVKGAVQQVKDTETFSGDGSNDVFTLAKKPISVTVTVSGSEKVCGVEGSTSGSYDYTVDKEDKEIIFEAGSIPGVGVNNVVVEYVNAIPVPVQVEDAESIDTYGVHIAEKYFEDIQSVTDAENRGLYYLSQYGEPFVRVELWYNGIQNYVPGTKVRVIDSISGEDRELVIVKVVKQYPYKYDVITLGNKEWKTSDWGIFTLERLRRLEESNQQDTELLVKRYDYARSVDIHRRYLKVLKTTLSDVSFIWGHSKSAWNSGAWHVRADLIVTEDVLQRLVWPDQKYVEKFIDTDFQGTGTANWNTTSHQLEF